MQLLPTSLLPTICHPLSDHLAYNNQCLHIILDSIQHRATSATTTSIISTLRPTFTHPCVITFIYTNEPILDFKTQHRIFRWPNLLQYPPVSFDCNVDISGPTCFAFEEVTGDIELISSCTDEKAWAFGEKIIALIESDYFGYPGSYFVISSLHDLKLIILLSVVSLDQWDLQRRGGDVDSFIHQHTTYSFVRTILYFVFRVRCACSLALIST